MSNATVPNLATIPQTFGAALATASGAAELGLTAPTNIVQLAVAAAGGTYVRRWKVMGRNGALTAGQVRLFKKNGANYYLLREMIIPVSSAPSATQAAFDSDWETLDLNLESGDELHVTTTVTQNLVVVAEGADYTA